MPRSFVTKYLDKYIVDDGGCGLFKIVLQFQYYSNIITSYKQLVAVDFASWKKTMRRNRRNSRTLHSGGTDTPVCVMTVSDIFLTCYNDKDFFFKFYYFDRSQISLAGMLKQFTPLPLSSGGRVNCLSLRTRTMSRSTRSEIEHLDNSA